MVFHFLLSTDVSMNPRPALGPSDLRDNDELRPCTLSPFWRNPERINNRLLLRGRCCHLHPKIGLIMAEATESKVAMRMHEILRDPLQDRIVNMDETS
jgi:hypothetical protein